MRPFELLSEQIEIPGIPIVISGPSGAGKGTVIRALLERRGDLSLSVSMTTRTPRAGEADGEHYFFRTKTEFEDAIKNGELLEWAEFCGNYYGTPTGPVREKLASGSDVILEIDVQGGLAVRKVFPDGLYIFVLPPNWTELRRRLADRGTETEESLSQRLARARRELAHIEEYDYIVINHTVETCLADIEMILSAAYHERKRLRSVMKGLDWAEILERGEP